MSTNSNGISSPCKNKVDGEAVGSRPTRCVHLPIKKKKKMIWKALFNKKKKKKNLILIFQNYIKRQCYSIGKQKVILHEIQHNTLMTLTQ